MAKEEKKGVPDKNVAKKSLMENGIYRNISIRELHQFKLLIINQNSEANLQLSDSIMQLNDSTVLIYLLT